ncbi:MAG: hypothetical protein ACK54F_13735 [Planctomycetia bacterium]|jgi:hypothetical protein
MLRPGWFACVGLIAACIGCAHHRNDYAYAPPYAPPVYPQPQAPALPAAPTGPPAVVMSSGAEPAAAMPGPVVASHSSPCPNDCGQGQGVVTSGHVVVEGAGQTPPCPPGP